MALATTCPRCKTSFKVVPDQLKLRRGLVRCGACQHVFSGIDFLRYVDESKRSEASPPDAVAPPAGDDLKTAFFLPETILATPYGEREVDQPLSAAAAALSTPREVAPADAGAQDRERADEATGAGPGDAADAVAPAATSPLIGTTDLDLLALQPGPLSAPVPSSDAAATADGGEWPGNEVDWPFDVPVDDGGPGAADAEAGAPRAERAEEIAEAVPGIEDLPASGLAAMAEAHGATERGEAIDWEAGPSEAAPIEASPIEAAADDAQTGEPRVEPPAFAEIEAWPVPPPPAPPATDSADADDADAEAEAIGRAGPGPAADRDTTGFEPWDATEAVDGDAIVAWGADVGAEAEPNDEREPIESLTATTPVGFAEADSRDDNLADALADAASPSRGRAPLAAQAAASWEPARAGTRASDRERAVAFEAPDARDDETAIDYFSSGRRGVGFVDRHGPVALVGAALLALLLGAQWTLAQRSMIAARVPALAPVISTVLAPFGLRVGLPRDLESLTIESFELQASASPGVLAMSALLRNRADYGVQWPSMQLTLTDASNRVLVRKVLGPEDYLREAGGGEGLPPRAEWPLRLALEANDLQPAGYSVILFYP